MPNSSSSLSSCCCLCQQTTTSYWNPVLKAPVCRECRTVFHYNTVNEATAGQPLKRFPSFSLEFEIAASQQVGVCELDRALLLVKHHFKRTRDGSVDYEYKSPIFHRIGAARQSLAVMDTLADLVSDHCGTHLHVACKYKEWLRPIQGDIFSPLLTHMLQHPAETTRFWGRYFNTYATPINQDRYHCFNLDSRCQTLEFRLPRFRTAEQYLQVIKFARTSVAYLDRVMQTLAQAHHMPPAPTSAQRSTPFPLEALPAAALGRHVLQLYRTHVDRVKIDTSWFARLSPQEQLRLQTFAHPEAEPRVSLSFSEDEDEEDEDDEDEDEGDW